MLSFKFRKEMLEDGSYSYRPVIPVKFINGTRFLNSFVLLDSGADITVLTWGHAVILGLKLSKEKSKLYGFKEEASVYESAVEIEIGSGRLAKRISVPVLVLSEEEPRQENDAVIGLRGFFDEFDIRFKLASNKIEMKPVDALRRRRGICR